MKAIEDVTEDDLNKLKEQLKEVLDILRTDLNKLSKEELIREVNKTNNKLKDILYKETLGEYAFDEPGDFFNNEPGVSLRNPDSE